MRSEQDEHDVEKADTMFTEPEDPTDGWVDVRMTDPEEGGGGMWISWLSMGR